MAVAEWRYLLTDGTYVPQGELFDAHDQTLNLALNRIDTASFSLRSGHPMIDLAAGLDAFLKIYRDDDLMFFGPLISSQEGWDENGFVVSVNAASPAWYLQHRMPNKTGVPVPYNGGVSADRALICRVLITAYLQWQYADIFLGVGDPGDILDLWPSPLLVGMWKNIGYIPIDTDTLPMTAASSSVYNTPSHQPMMDIISELSASTDGFDWRIEPVENWADGELNSIYIGNMTAAPVIGDDKPGVAFELGDGRNNMRTYTRTIDRETLANLVQHVVPGDTAPPYAIDGPSMTKWGAQDVVVQADLTTVALRQALVDEHLAVRKSPREIIVFEPEPDYGDGRVPRYGIDYSVGDVVRGKAIVDGKQRFWATFRVWAVDFSFDDNGVETVKLTLTEE